MSGIIWVGQRMNWDVGDHMDIGTYNHLDLAARATLSSWTHESVFAPVTFERTGFPTRISHIGQIRSLLAGMHGASRIQNYLEELGGLRPDDVVQLKAAVSLYCRWYRTVFPSRSGYMPLSDILAQYIAYTKFKSLPSHGRILEVGPGYGFTSLFVAQDQAIQAYDAIEIAQPLYVIQSLLNSTCFGERFCNAALDQGDDSPFHDFDDGRDGGVRFRYHYDRSFRCTLFPWWMIETPFSRTYDVIMANAIVAEMTGAALSYYLPKWHAALADDGCLLIQDLGQVTTRKPEEVLQRFAAAGFRALAQGRGRIENAFLPFWNLLLVTDRHPDYGRALPVGTTTALLSDHPTVRAVFGLDRARGEMVPTETLGAVLSEA